MRFGILFASLTFAATSLADEFDTTFDVNGRMLRFRSLKPRVLWPTLSFLLAAPWISVAAFAQTAEGPSAAETVEVEIFKGPSSKKLVQPAYPVHERLEANEGWVKLNFMIDPTGKPYAISVSDSTGIAAFQRAAISAVEQSTFEPATLNGVPIDSSYSLKMAFHITEPMVSASPKFLRSFRNALKAIDAKDRTTADALMHDMEVTNLYEDAFFNLVRYNYYWQWGDKAQQLDALERAIAHEDNAKYLPKPTFEAALLTMMQLKYEARDFAGFLELWARAQKLGIEKPRLALWEPVIADLEKLRTDHRSYAVPGSFGAATSWSYTLHKNNFRIEVAAGRIGEVKLRCEKKYVFFKFDPTLQYSINDKFGSCAMELIGDPATQFSLIQS